MNVLRQGRNLKRGFCRKGEAIFGRADRRGAEAGRGWGAGEGVGAAVAAIAGREPAFRVSPAVVGSARPVCRYSPSLRGPASENSMEKSKRSVHSGEEESRPRLGWFSRPAAFPCRAVADERVGREHREGTAGAFRYSHHDALRPLHPDACYEGQSGWPGREKLSNGRRGKRQVDTRTIRGSAAPKNAPVS